MKKHIVFLLGSYYPHYSAVGRCLGNIADVFEDKYRVTVIGMLSQSNQLHEEEYRSQKIIRVTTRRNNRRICLEESNTVDCLGGLLQKSKRILSQINNVLYLLSPGGSAAKDWIASYKAALRKISDPIDLIIPTCNPFETVIVALDYKKEHPQTEVIPFLFDLYADNQRMNRTSFIKRMKWNKNIKLEKRMLQEANFVFYVPNWTSHIKKYHHDQLSHCQEVEHPLLVKRDVKNGDIPIISDSPERILHIVYTGVVDLQNRNPRFMLAIIPVLGIYNLSFDFYAFGSADHIIENAAKEEGRVKYFGKVSTFEAETARCNSDFLLSLGNSDFSQVPSKLFEYFSVGKPIVHFALTKDDPAIKLLEGYPCKLILLQDDNPKRNAEKLESFIEKNSGEKISINSIFEVYKYAQPTEIAKAIEAHMS